MEIIFILIPILVAFITLLSYHAGKLIEQERNERMREHERDQRPD